MTLLKNVKQFRLLITPSLHISFLNDIDKVRRKSEPHTISMLTYNDNSEKEDKKKEYDPSLTSSLVDLKKNRRDVVTFSCVSFLFLFLLKMIQ